MQRLGASATAATLVQGVTVTLKSMGSDLGGAVKGFKDGMKDGSTSDSAATPPNGQVASPAVADKTTIDVEAKHKS